MTNKLLIYINQFIYIYILILFTLKITIHCSIYSAVIIIGRFVRMFLCMLNECPASIYVTGEYCKLTTIVRKSFFGNNIIK